MGELKPSGKPFEISKAEVWQAWQKVRANKGAPGVDGVSIEAFEADCTNQLYKVWNRMSSGSYFPPPVLLTSIPKSGGGVRELGVPTVADRIAQTVVAGRLEKRVESIFHPDSYGYRPGRSALDAVGLCRSRCWKSDWVIDLDIEKFFDTVPWDLMLKAVEANTDQAWVVLYVKRWLAAPLQDHRGVLQWRDQGTPQGSAVSPVLANLFLHYAFDAWMGREFPALAFERYVDDVVVHCVSQSQALAVLVAIESRMEQVGLRLHPVKTRVVYCEDGKRRERHEHTQFTFLGFDFRQRRARAKSGKMFNSFLPAVSKDAVKRMGERVRSWRIHRRTDLGLADLARWVDPVARGWMQYYGSFYRSALYPVLSRINTYLMRWLRRKYKRLRSKKAAFRWWQGIVRRFPAGFAHWWWVPSLTGV